MAKIAQQVRKYVLALQAFTFFALRFSLLELQVCMQNAGLTLNFIFVVLYPLPCGISHYLFYRVNHRSAPSLFLCTVNTPNSVMVMGMIQKR